MDSFARVLSKNESRISFRNAFLLIKTADYPVRATISGGNIEKFYEFIIAYKIVFILQYDDM